MPKVSVDLDVEGFALNPSHNDVSVSGSATARQSSSRSSRSQRNSLRAGRRSTRYTSDSSPRSSSSEGDGGVGDTVAWIWNQATHVALVGYDALANAVSSVVATSSEDTAGSEEVTVADNPAFRVHATTDDL
jgi:plastocyanin